MTKSAALPLSGIKVLDFSTLLPGPLAGLILAEAGASVVKIERPQGEDARYFPPYWAGHSAFYALLNAGKSSLSLDLKDSEAIAALKPLIADADVLVEQFRPGVMERLGLGYADCAALNERLIYCSITGYGADGPKAHTVGHDLNYIGDTGLLDLSSGPSGAPTLPPALVADIAGGSMPAVMNILLALLAREKTGKGCHLDIAMCDAMFMFSFWAQAQGHAAGQWPKSGDSMLTGGSPRYQLYAAADGRLVAVAALEQKFWINFCNLIALPENMRDDLTAPQETRLAVARLIARQPSSHWKNLFDGQDCCCSVVAGLEEAWRDEHFRARGLFKYRVSAGGEGTIPALCVPICPQFRALADEPRLVEALGQGNGTHTGAVDADGN